MTSPPGKVTSWLPPCIPTPSTPHPPDSRGMRREEDTTSLSATAKVLMSWAKHCCLLKIEGSYQLVAEDTPLCAPWSDNSPLCSAIGFPHLPGLSAPTRTVLHSLAWQRTAVTLPKLSLSGTRGERVLRILTRQHVTQTWRAWSKNTLLVQY